MPCLPNIVAQLAKLVSRPFATKKKAKRHKFGSSTFVIQHMSFFLHITEAGLSQKESEQDGKAQKFSVWKSRQRKPGPGKASKRRTPGCKLPPKNQESKDPMRPWNVWHCEQLETLETSVFFIIAPNLARLSPQESKSERICQNPIEQVTVEDLETPSLP